MVAPLASSSGLDFSSGQLSDSQWAYRPASLPELPVQLDPDPNIFIVPSSVI